MSEQGLKMKYFVLNPSKRDPYGEASRKAMLKYAYVIESVKPTLAHELRLWIYQIEDALECLDQTGK